MVRFLAFIPLALAAFVLAASAPSTADAAFTAESKDPRGDSTSSHPGRDLVAAGIGFDRKSGLMVGYVRFRGAPTDGGEGFVTLYAGMRTRNGCNGYPAGGFGAFTDSFDGYWVRQNGPDKAKYGEAQKTGYKAVVQQFEVRTKKLAGQRWNCLSAVLVDPEEPSTVFDTLTPATFRGLPELSVRTPRVRRAIPVNRWRKLRIRVSNPGDAALRNVRVRIGPARGVNVRPRSRFIKVIPARKHRVIVVRVRPRARAYSSVDHSVRVRAGKLRGETELTYRVRHPRKKSSGGGGGSDSGGGVCIQYFPDLSGESGGSLGLVPC